MTKEEQEEVRKAAEQRRALEAKQLGESINALLKTADGKRVFGFLCRVCGFNRSSLVVDLTTGDIKNSSTAYNEARREIYLRLRAFADSNLLKEIEYQKENQ